MEICFIKSGELATLHILLLLLGTGLGWVWVYGKYDYFVNGISDDACDSGLQLNFVLFKVKKAMFLGASAIIIITLNHRVFRKVCNIFTGLCPLSSP